MRKQTLLTRWQAALSKIRQGLADSLVREDYHRTETLIKRFNCVARHQRARNLSNGMPGSPWIDLTTKSPFL